MVSVVRTYYQARELVTKSVTAVVTNNCS